MLDVSVERVWPLGPIQLSPYETQRLVAIIRGFATKVNDLRLLKIKDGGQKKKIAAYPKEG